MAWPGDDRLAFAIVDRDRLNAELRIARWRDGGEQRRAERQQPSLASGRALGKEQRGPAVAERIGDGVDLVARLAARLASDEDRTGLARQPADQRPARDLGLGDEGA